MSECGGNARLSAGNLPTATFGQIAEHVQACVECDTFLQAFDADADIHQRTELQPIGNARYGELLAFHMERRLGIRP